MSKKRDNGYYLKRLERERPDVHADYLAGAYKTADSALRAAGLKKERTSLHELKNAWRKATAAEQDDFKRHIGCMPGVIASAPPTPPRVFSVDGRPEPWVLERHDEIMIYPESYGSRI